MTERDPFGRLPNENPLDFLGKPTNGTHAAAAEAVAADEAAKGSVADAPRRSSRHAKLRRPRSSGLLDSTQITTIARRTIKTVVVLAVLVAFGGGLAALLLVSGGTTRSVVREGVVRSVAAPAPAGSARSAPRSTHPRSTLTPSGGPARSLLTGRAFAAALARLRRGGLGRLRTLSISPGHVDAQLLTRGGRLRTVQVAAGGEPRTLATSAAGFGALPTIAFARVDAGAPARLARSAAKRLGQPLSHVDHVVLLRLGSALTWSVYLRDGKQLLADAHGRIRRRVR